MKRCFTFAELRGGRLPGGYEFSIYCHEQKFINNFTDPSRSFYLAHFKRPSVLPLALPRRLAYPGRRHHRLYPALPQPRFSSSFLLLRLARDLSRSLNFALSSGSLTLGVVKIGGEELSWPRKTRFSRERIAGARVCLGAAGIPFALADPLISDDLLINALLRRPSTPRAEVGFFACRPLVLETLLDDESSKTLARIHRPRFPRGIRVSTAIQTPSGKMHFYPRRIVKLFARPRKLIIPRAIKILAFRGLQIRLN